MESGQRFIQSLKEFVPTYFNRGLRTICLEIINAYILTQPN